MLSLISVTSNISTHVLKNPKSISPGNIFFPRATTYIFLCLLDNIFFFSYISQITLFRHVQNITFIFTQVKLFLYKPTPLYMFPISDNENKYPTICSSHKFGWHPCRFHLPYLRYPRNPQIVSILPL